MCVASMYRARQATFLQIIINYSARLWNVPARRRRWLPVFSVSLVPSRRRAHFKFVENDIRCSRLEHGKLYHHYDLAFGAARQLSQQTNESALPITASCTARTRYVHCEPSTCNYWTVVMEGWWWWWWWRRRYEWHTGENSSLKGCFSFRALESFHTFEALQNDRMPEWLFLSNSEALPKERGTSAAKRKRVQSLRTALFEYFNYNLPLFNCTVVPLVQGPAEMLRSCAISFMSNRNQGWWRCWCCIVLGWARGGGGEKFN